MLLPEPYEFLDLHDGESITLRIDSFTDGSAVIHPNNPTPRHVRIHMEQKSLDGPPAPGTPIQNEISILRIVGRRVDGDNLEGYWDISSKRLRADLLARLTNRQSGPLTVSISAHGHKPHKRFSVAQAN
jgi:hypothetical protein